MTENYSLSELASVLKAEKAKINLKKQEEETQIKESFDEALSKLIVSKPEFVVEQKQISRPPIVKSVLDASKVDKPKLIEQTPKPVFVKPIKQKQVPVDDIAIKFKKLQEEFAFLKRAVASANHSGGGEVRLLNLDDVNTDNINQDAILAFDSQSRSLNFYQPHDKVFSNVISKPTVINEDMSYIVLSYLKIHNTLHVKGNLGIR